MPEYTDHNDITWFYHAEGEGDLIVFVHGWGVDHRIWRQQIKHFRAHHRVIAPDLPGHGQSRWKEMSLDGLADGLAGIIQKETNEPVTLVGSSMGGLIGLCLVDQYAEVVGKLALVGSQPRFARSDSYPGGISKTRLDHLRKQIQRSWPSILDVFFRSLFTDQERMSRRFHWLQVFRREEQKPLKEAVERYLMILEQEDLRPVYENLAIPLCLMHGTEDEIVSDVSFEFMKRVHPEALTVEFQAQGHFPFLCKPKLFNTSLQAFLASG